jgi:hypothetical protein
VKRRGKLEQLREIVVDGIVRVVERAMRCPWIGRVEELRVEAHPVAMH